MMIRTGAANNGEDCKPWRDFYSMQIARKTFWQSFCNTDWLANYSGFMNKGDKGNGALKIDKGSFRAVFGKQLKTLKYSKKSVFELINWSLTASTLV